MIILSFYNIYTFYKCYTYLTLAWTTYSICTYTYNFTSGTIKYIICLVPKGSSERNEEIEDNWEKKFSLQIFLHKFRYRFVFSGSIFIYEEICYLPNQFF